MSVSYFNVGSLSADFSDGEEGSIVKDALVLVEGTHTDNSGNTHVFSKDRVMRNALNTNEAIRQGEIIPFKANHSKDVRDDMGEIISDVECRLITENDLPNPKHKHLLGKLGAFTKVEIKKNLDDVKNKIIKSLSPGIDVIKDRLIEVSAVSRPAILGPALFGASGSLSFKEAKEQTEEFRKLRNALEENFEIFCQVTMNVLSLDDEMGFEGKNQDSLLLTAIEEFSESIAEELGVKLNQGGSIEPASQQKLYDDNPYADTIVNPNPNNKNFSSEERGIITFPLKKKRRKSKAS